MNRLLTCTGGDDLGLAIGGRSKLIGECISSHELTNTLRSRGIGEARRDSEYAAEYMLEHGTDPDFGTRDFVDMPMYKCIPHDNCPISVGHPIGSFSPVTGISPYGERWRKSVPKERMAEGHTAQSYIDDGRLVRTWSNDVPGMRDSTPGHWATFPEDPDFFPRYAALLSPPKTAEELTAEERRDALKAAQINLLLGVEINPDMSHWEVIDADLERQRQVAGFDQFSMGSWANYTNKNMPYWNSSWPQESEIGAFVPGMFNNAEDYRKPSAFVEHVMDPEQLYSFNNSFEMKYYGKNCSNAIFMNASKLSLRENHRSDFTMWHYGTIVNPDVPSTWRNKQRNIVSALMRTLEQHDNHCCVPADPWMRVKRNQVLYAGAVLGEGGSPQRLPPGTLGGDTCSETIVDPYSCVKPVYDRATKVLMEVSDFCCGCGEIKKTWPLVKPDECKDWYGGKSCRKLTVDPRFKCGEGAVLHRVPYPYPWNDQEYPGIPFVSPTAQLYPLKISRNTAHMQIEDACCLSCSNAAVQP